MCMSSSTLPWPLKASYTHPAHKHTHVGNAHTRLSWGSLASWKHLSSLLLAGTQALTRHSSTRLLYIAQGHCPSCASSSCFLQLGENANILLIPDSGDHLHLLHLFIPLTVPIPSTSMPTGYPRIQNIRHRSQESLNSSHLN